MFDDAAEPLIHIVDDEPAVRDSLAALLKSVGYRTCAYESAETYLSSDSAFVPGCLILDLRMPRKSGLQLLKELRDKEIDTPVIMISGHADVRNAVDAMRLGAVNFFEKPINSQMLLDQVNACLARREKNGDGDSLRLSVQRLTTRERQVLHHMILGHSSREIGERLAISDRTVEAHRRNILMKFGVRTTVQLSALFHASDQIGIAAMSR